MKRVISLRSAKARRRFRDNKANAEKRGIPFLLGGGF